MMARAYTVQQYQTSGPDWLESERFDVVAKFPADSKPDQMPLMLQALLADRFKLTLHHEAKDRPVFALTIGKNGPKLKTIESEYGVNKNSNRVSAHVVAKASMHRFAGFLSSELSRPVLDKTGL